MLRVTNEQTILMREDGYFGNLMLNLENKAVVVKSSADFPDLASTDIPR